jgi:alpha,alpha-trehalose-phosphate synthase [UDP-forming]
MRQIALIAGGVILALALIVVGSTFFQANGEELRLTADLQYRTRVLADSLTEAIGPSFNARATSTVQQIVDRISGNDRIAALGVYDSGGMLIASSSAYSATLSTSPLVASAMDSDTPAGSFVQTRAGRAYALVEPLENDSRVTGALMIVQNASYIDDAVAKIWTDNIWRLLLQILLVGAAIYLLVRWVFFKPISRLVESMRSVRAGEVPAEQPAEEHVFLMPLKSEISRMTSSLQHARFVAGQEARMRLEKLDTPWTAERLKEFIKATIKDRPIYVLSNREPYVHAKDGGKISWSVPAGGVVTALEPVMEATGGMWIAYGGGSADRETSDSEGKLKVPPDEPRYTLKRISISKRDLGGYYSGFSNEALWPLCHMAHIRPLFRKEDWLAYRRVNGLFAKTLLSEIKDVERPIVLVQDYHLALVPEMIKKSRPDAQIAMFWHIPWPSAAQFSICPWRAQLLQGMLGADVIGFHTQQYCNDFMETVGAEIESRIDYESFSITHADHRSLIRPFPISIAFPGSAEPKSEADRSVLEKLGVHAKYIGVGVDRLDYTKGIMERFKAVEFLLDSHPQYHGEFTLVQVASPTRESVEAYRAYAEQVEAEAARINEKFGTRDWKPIHLERRNWTHSELQPLYQLANVCLVTSVHDGMNLVAKEFVASRHDESGVLILSQFTGASRTLKNALIVNPYSAEETAEAMHTALSMSPAEQHRRMKAMRATVSDYNIYRWSAELIRTLTRSA